LGPAPNRTAFGEQLSTGVYDQALNLNAIFRQGIQWVRLEQAVADQALAEAAKVLFKPEPGADAGAHGKAYAHRHDALWPDRRIPDALTDLASRIVQPVQDVLQPMFGPLVVGHPSIYDCRCGYWMEWHDHLTQRSVVDLLLYLSDAPITDRDGGALEVARCHRGNRGAILHRSVTAQHVPKHADLAVVDAQTPLFQHRVLPFASNKRRILFAIPLGAVDF